MAALSNYAEAKVLEHLVGKLAMPKPTVSVALYTVAPTDEDAGTEVSGGGYQRIATTPTDWTNASNGSISNAVVIDDDAATISGNETIYFVPAEAIRIDSEYRAYVTARFNDDSTRTERVDFVVVPRR